MKRGVLLPIFSLPSEYGIGDFGYEAYEFIDILSENNIDYWEVLPLNESDGLPYSPISFFALNIDYISIDKLINVGLLKKSEKTKKAHRIKYGYFKEKYYKEAYKNFIPTKEFEKFCENEKLLEYAKYMVEYEKENMPEKYYLFLQYILDKQWNELKNYANKNGVKIIGDMPIYPAFKSVEVEFHSKNFELKNGKMEFVSGAPPDKFNKDGQKWGHPLYDFNYMKKDNYSYLISKFKEYLKRYDLVRIDHFRAYDSYYKIPVNGEAKDGMYSPGPSYDFFDKLLETEALDRIIVEDLGDIREETIKLKEKYNFTGMKLLHYSLNLKEGKDTLLDENRFIYTANHDDNTTVGWYKSMKFIDKIRVKRFLKKHKCYSRKINVSIIKYCLKTKAKVTIVPVQDILGLDDTSRINIPGQDVGDNWSWELEDFEKLRKKIKVLSEKKLLDV